MTQLLHMKMQNTLLSTIYEEYMIIMLIMLSTILGNGALTFSAGLITIDETSFA